VLLELEDGVRLLATTDGALPTRGAALRVRASETGYAIDRSGG